jgi:hypothetical protein
MTWTPETVRARFVEACDTERRLPKGGGAGKTGFWPGYEHSFEDMNGWGAARLAEERELFMRRLPPSAAAVSRFEEVMRWSSSLIDDDRKRRIVWAWAWCRMSGSSFAARCKRNGWVKMTAYRRLATSIDKISDNLNNDGVLLRFPEERWLLPETANSATDSGTLALPDTPPPPAIHPTSEIFDGDRPRHTLTTPQAIEEFTKHLAKVNRARRKEQEREAARRRKLGVEAA